jgi:Protein of unknown function (DUF2721)
MQEDLVEECADYRRAAWACTRSGAGAGRRGCRGVAMFASDAGGAGLDMIAHIIQEALTPVFLLSGIATLLSVFSTRLARVGDRVEAVGAAMAASGAPSAALAAELARLRRRSLALDIAVVLGAVGGAATCGAVLTLFVGSLRDATVAWLLFALFGTAVVCALGGIIAFTAEMLMAGIGIRTAVAMTRHPAGEPAEAAEPHPHVPDPPDDSASDGAG